MANKIEVAQAFVTIIPSMKGAQRTISQELGAEKIGDEAGKQMGGGIIASLKDIAIGTALGGMIQNGLSSALEGAKQLFSDAFDGIADYQQNVGGIQKLYGNMGQSLEEYAESVGKSTAAVQDEWQALENAQNTVLKNAQDAYKTTGMSANTYMETATSFSAALINSLGGDSEKAAAQTQVAMEAIADNWNTFGGDLGLIQGTFQSLARGQYTMLDNLRLGYGGTKSELERLISDANLYAESIGQASDLSIDNFSDIVTAIQLIQQKQNIAGTAAMESTQTISGSLTMLDSAWQNWLTSLGNGTADMGAQTQAVVDSLGAVAANVVPVVIQMGTSAIQAIPMLITNAFAAVQQAIVPAIDSVTGGAASRFMEGFGKIRESLAPVGEAFQLVFGKAQEWIGRLAGPLGELAHGAMALMQAAASNLGRAFEILTPLISIAADNFGGILSAAISVVAGLFEGLAKILQGIGDFMAPLVEGMVSGFEEIAEAIGPIIDGIGGLVGGIGDFFKDPIKAIGDFVTGGSKDMNKFADNTKKSFESTGKTVKNVAENMARNVSSNTQTMSKTAATNMGTMATNAGTKMTDVYNKVNKAMTDSVTKTRTSTQTMQTTINTLKGKTVDLKAKNALGNIVQTTQTAVNKFVGKTVDLRAKNALGDTVTNTQKQVDKFKGKTVDLATKLGNGFADTIRKAKEYIGGVNGKTVDITLNVKKKGIREISVEQSYSSTGNPKYYVRTTMAQGGFLLGPTNVLAGEAGTEAIVPLSNTKYARPFAQAVAAEIDRDGGGGVTISGNTFIVRKEDDIEAISNSLYNQITRRNGARL